MSAVCRSFSDEHGPGTFHSLGDLPKRKPHRKLPVFHLLHDDDEHSSSLDEHLQLASLPPPSVPFPRSPSPPSPSCSISPPPRPQLSRGASVPILLPNGKPLKPSLKISSSSPTISTPPQAQHTHLRACSEPATLPASPKNVHFPEKDYALATVRVFSRSASPAALRNPTGSNGDETETEGEEPLPFSSLSSLFNYEISPSESSPIPAEFSPTANLLIESLNLSSSSSSNQAAKPVLAGSVLVRNLAFEKHVAIRFTLDEWQTVSEVGAHYHDSLSLFPSKTLPSPSAAISEDISSKRGRGWDRFTFTIRLEDYALSLSTRTLWLAARYCVGSTYPEPGSVQYGPGGEWWDSNGGRNYRVCFRPTVVAPASFRSRPRAQSASGSFTSSRTQPQPPLTCKEHALGQIIPSVPKEVQPVNQTHSRPVSLRTGKLSLCNYAPPAARVTLSATVQSLSDEDSVSPTSSTLSTPSASPTMSPRVIINGQPATFIPPHHSCQEEDVTSSSGLGYTADWYWSAQNESWIEGRLRQHADLVSASALSVRLHDIPSPPGGKALADSHSLYDAFVTKWCFAREPSPNHPGYNEGGIM